MDAPGAPLIEVKVNKAQLRAVHQMLRDVPSGLKRTMSRAINRTAISARAAIVNRVYGLVAAKKGAIRKAITLKRATFSRWAADLGVYGERIPIFAFGARQTKRGVTYKISRGGGRKTISKAFIAKMKSGHTGVFERKNEQPSRFTRKPLSAGIYANLPRKYRLPILEKFGPSVGGVFVRDTTGRRQVEAKAGLDLEKNIDSQVRLLISRRAR